MTNLIDPSGLQGAAAACYNWARSNNFVPGAVIDDYACAIVSIIENFDEIAAGIVNIGKAFTTSSTVASWSDPIDGVYDVLGVDTPERTTPAELEDINIPTTGTITSWSPMNGAYDVLGFDVPESAIPAELDDINIPTTEVITALRINDLVGIDARTLVEICNSGICGGLLGELLNKLVHAGILYLSSSMGSNSASSSRYGDCTEEQHSFLANQVTLQCKSGRITGCGKKSLKKYKQQIRQPGQKIKDITIERQHVEEIIRNNLDCQNARKTVQQTCFSDSPDRSHNQQIKNLEDSLRECNSLLDSL